MNLRKKMAAITAVAMLAFAGVGFASWAFTKQVSEEAPVTGVVTAAIEAKDVTADPAAFYLICDAPSGEEGLVAGNGIYWSDTAENDGSVLTSINLTGTVTENDENLLDFSKYKGRFVITAEALDTTYVDIAAVNLTTDLITVDSKNGNCEYEYTLPALSYAAVPTSVAQVTAMNDELAASTIKFTVKFNVESVL